MVDSSLRALKTKLFRPVAARFADVPPSAVTGSGLALGLCCAVAVVLNRPFLALALWLLNRLADGLDGELARASGRQSDLGGYLDILADHAVYAALPLALAWQSADAHAWPAAALLVASFYVNAVSWMYLSALQAKRRTAHEGPTSVAMPSSLVEGGETVVFFGAMLLVPAAFAPLALFMAALRAQGLADRDILDINLITSYFNFVNRLALGLGVEFSAEEVAGYRY